MNESNSIETIDRTNLTEQTKIRLDKITEIENYFHRRLIKENHAVKTKQICSCFWLHRKGFNCFKCNNWKSTYLFVNVVGAPVGIESASFNLIFSLTTGIVKNLLSTTRNKKKKHYKIFMLAKSKLNSIKVLISRAWLIWKWVTKNILQF